MYVRFIFLCEFACLRIHVSKYLRDLPRYTKPHRCTCTRFCSAQGEQQCAVSITCSISRQASPSSGGVQTVLFPPQWYSTCSLACSRPCCPPPVQCGDTHTHTPTYTEKPGHITVVTWLKTDGVNSSISSSSIYGRFVCLSLQHVCFCVN